MTYEDKRKILDCIESNVTPFVPRGSMYVSIRCPYCGDTEKDLTHTHCYIKCSYDQTEPLLWKCFLCNRKGVVNKTFLTKLNITDDSVIDMVNQTRSNMLSRQQVEEAMEAIGSVDMDSPQVHYINKRLGDGLTLDDYDKFRIVWNMDALRSIITNKKTQNMLPSNTNTVSFMSNDNSLLLTRTFDHNSNGSQWHKTRIKPGSQFYTIKSSFDLFTSDPIYVNIAEGIFDIISVYKNFNKPNSAYIACLGSDYINALDNMIDRGLIGTNVNVHIYVDNGIDEKMLRFNLKKYKWMFGSIHILRNTKSKDVGVRIEEIFLVDDKL